MCLCSHRIYTYLSTWFYYSLAGQLGTVKGWGQTQQRCLTKSDVLHHRLGKIVHPNSFYDGINEVYFSPECYFQNAATKSGFLVLQVFDPYNFSSSSSTSSLFFFFLFFLLIFFFLLPFLFLYFFLHLPLIYRWIIGPNLTHVKTFVDLFNDCWRLGQRFSVV